MTTPEPTPPDPKQTITALIDAFKGLDPILRYGGLITVVGVVILWLTGVFPEIFLIYPAFALIVFIGYAYLNNRHEMEKERLKAQQESEKRQLEGELERLKLRQKGDLEKARLDQEVELKKIEVSQPLASVKPQPDEPPSETVWPASYLTHVWYDCFQLHMTSIDPRAQELGASVLNLHSVFTGLDVHVTLDIKEMTEKQTLLAWQDPKGRTREPALAFLGRSENKYLVLLGQPGSGKSTLVKYLALCLSGAGLQKDETNLETLIDQGWRLPALMPVMVVLRDYAARGLPQNQSLWEFVGDGLKSAGLSGSVKELSQELRQRGGILLLDGLD